MTKFSLYAFSVSLALFGAFGWGYEVDWSNPSTEWAKPSVLICFTVFAAIAIPTLAEKIGKAWASLGLIFPIIVFTMITAFSTHNAIYILVENPREIVHTAEEQSAYDNAKTRWHAQQQALDAIKLDVEGLGPQTTKARTASYNIQRAAQSKEVEGAKNAFDVAKQALEVRRNNFKPYAQDAFYWIIGAALDLGLAIAFACVGMTDRRIKFLKDADDVSDAKMLAEQSTLNLEHQEVDLSFLEETTGVKVSDDNIVKLMSAK